MSKKIKISNLFSFSFLFCVLSAPVSPVLSTELSEGELEAERNFNASLQYLGKKLGYQEFPVIKAFQTLQNAYVIKRSNIQKALLIAKNPSYSVDTTYSVVQEDSISYVDICHFTKTNFMPNATKNTLPLHIGGTLSAVLGEGSTFYTRNDSYGFKLFSEEIKLLSSLNTDESILEEKEEESAPRRKRKGKGKGKEKTKEKLIPLPWGGGKGAESLLDHHKELNRQKEKKYLEKLEFFCMSIGKSKEQVRQGNFVHLGPYSDSEKMLGLHEKRKKEYDQICSDITKSMRNDDYEEECRSAFSQFPFFFENEEVLKEILKNEEFRFFSRSWPEQSIYAFILYEDNAPKIKKRPSQARDIYSLLENVNLIKNLWNSKVNPDKYHIIETTEQSALIPFLELLGSNHSYCYNLDDFKGIQNEVESVNTDSSFYHFVGKYQYQRRKTEVHYFMKKSSSESK